MVKVLIAGDFCPNDRVSTLLQQKNYEEVLRDIEPMIKSADYSVVNLECPVVPDRSPLPIKKCGPNLSCSEEALALLKSSGFNLVTLANNHIRDFGDAGIAQTLASCKKYGLDTVGADVNLPAAKRIHYTTIKNVKIAFVNVCEHEFSIATEKNGGASPLDPVDTCRQLREARNHAEYVILIIHGGTEHYNLPTPRMKKWYRFFAENGASAVVNHHQHCYSGYEVFNGVPIFYGIGNFCFDSAPKRNDPWNYGYAVELNLGTQVSFEIHPFVQCEALPRVLRLHEKERDAFTNKITELNSIIADDKRLTQEYDRLVDQQYESFSNLFEPFANRYTGSMFSKGILPAYMTGARFLRLMNVIHCESHYELLRKVLDKKYNGNPD